ncbi:MAG: taurine dioxygenase [Halieaceae bacterium]|jgi:taurine dioxygenase
MHITPLSPGCGALVRYLQLATLSDNQLAELRAAFAEYGLLFFPDQELEPEDHLAFARHFGDIVSSKFFRPVPGYPQIAEVRKETAQQTNIEGGWHTDHSYDNEPALGSLLGARALPAAGGDTWFANLAAAYDALPDRLKRAVAPLRAVHSNVHLYGVEGYYRGTDLAGQLGGADRVGAAVHPVVVRHPESGRKVLYVNPGHTLSIEGWSKADSDALLEERYALVDQPQFTCEFNWLPGSVACWDNRSTWHFAQNDYQGEARLMHRITLAGSALRAVAEDSGDAYAAG